MTDFWADRIKLNPKLEISTTPAGGGNASGGIQDNTSGMGTKLVKIDSLGEKIDAPDEFPSPVARPENFNNTKVILQP